MSACVAECLSVVGAEVHMSLVWNARHLIVLLQGHSSREDVRHVVRNHISVFTLLRVSSQLQSVGEPRNGEVLTE